MSICLASHMRAKWFDIQLPVDFLIKKVSLRSFKSSQVLFAYLIKCPKQIQLQLPSAEKKRKVNRAQHKMWWSENHVQNINCLRAATHRFEGNKIQLKLGLACRFCFLSPENLKLQQTDLLLFKNTRFPTLLESVTAKNNRITFLLSYCWFLIFP